MNSFLAAFAGIGIALAMPVTVLHALDLTPRTVESTSEGGGYFQRLYFQEGREKYTVTPGEGTEASGSADEVTFSFTDLRAAACVFKISPHSPDDAFEGQALEGYRRTAASFAPPGATRPASKLEQNAPLTVNEWKSYRFQNTYRFPGSTICQAITFLNLSPKQQIILITTAFESDFANADARANAIIHSWRSIALEKLATPDLN